VSVFGTDYETPDGTGIRDYIHIEDLAPPIWRRLPIWKRGDSTRLMWDMAVAPASAR